MMPFDVAPADERAANVGFGVATEQNCRAEGCTHLCGAPEVADDVQQVCVVTLLVGRRSESSKRS
jgi:hypothetical protein